jgi:PKD repeat protein
VRPCEHGQRTFRYKETITFTVTAARRVGGHRLASRVAGRVLGRAPKGSCQLTSGRATDRLTGRRIDLPSPPSAAFSIVPVDLTAGATGYFTDESSDDGEVVSQIWDFGDPASGTANTASGPYPSHSYAAPETYRVTSRSPTTTVSATRPASSSR